MKTRPKSSSVRMAKYGSVDLSFVTFFNQSRRSLAMRIRRSCLVIWFKWIGCGLMHLGSVVYPGHLGRLLVIRRHGPKRITMMILH